MEREPNIRPWKAFPKERIDMSGEPGYQLDLGGRSYLVVRFAYNLIIPRV